MVYRREASPAVAADEAGCLAFGSDRPEPRYGIYFLHDRTGTLTQNASQVVAAAEAWCLALGSNRAEDIAFVKSEIHKAWAATEPRRTEVTGEKGAPTADKNELLPAVTSGVGPRGAGKDGAVRGEGRGERVVRGSRRREGDGARMTVESLLAADVEAGTSLFWVKVWGAVRRGAVWGGWVGYGFAAVLLWGLGRCYTVSVWLG